MNLEYVKLLSAFGLWLLTFAFSMLPVFWFKKYQLIDEERRRQNFRSMSFFNCFGAGVFLGTCLLHLLPDVQEQMAFIFKTANLQSTYPAAEFLFGFGFLTILVVEQIIMTFKGDDLDEPRPVLNTESSIDDSSHLIPPNTGHSSTDYGSINVNCDRHIEFSADDSSHLFPSNTGHSSTDYGSISINPDRHNHDVTFADSQASNSVFDPYFL
ncbi:hypothetical protein CEXT_269471 [Caerostris extrusa]|uniref:Uncharacterized protein n=1 Tax=Caerostris extrusa TaxID=172846 RepID=A0AAV4SHH7_CAEEX|nr:hypothetical protein CEXT_269471 [Caerostris extrusa]